MTSDHRGTIFLEEARVLEQRGFAGEQFVIRVEAPKCAARAVPGSFVYVNAEATPRMRRPLSIMRADARAGWIEMLYRVMGTGLHALATRKAGETLSVLGPIGKGFSLHPEKPRTLLIGAGFGNPPIIFLANRLRDDPRATWKPLVLMGSEIPFPFRARPSQILVPGVPPGVIACMPMLDEWGIPSRLATLADFPGCFDGYVTQLAEGWLASLGPAELAEVEIFASGAKPVVKASAALARKYGVACQVALEEYMACAVGACAGCAVQVQTEDGPAMKRVCVDGPVFDAYQVFAAA